MTEELYHHGIKGQKWGVKNGPPYPLDSKTHGAVVKSAGSLDKKKIIDRLIQEGSAAYKTKADLAYKQATENSKKKIEAAVNNSSISAKKLSAKEIRENRKKFKDRLDKKLKEEFGDDYENGKYKGKDPNYFQMVREDLGTDVIKELYRERKNQNAGSLDKKDIKNRVKALLGIYKSDDDNPYVSQERRKRRATEEKLPEELKKGYHKAKVNATKKEIENAERISKEAKERAKKAKERLEKLEKKQTAGGIYNKNWRQDWKEMDPEEKKKRKNALARNVAINAASFALYKGLVKKGYSKDKALSIATSVDLLGMSANNAKMLYDLNKKNSNKAKSGSLLNNKKDRNPDGSLTDEAKRRKSKGKEYSEDYWKAHDKKNAKYMSDVELQKRIQRLNNENQYNNLTKSEARKEGEKFAKDVLKAVTTSAILYGVTTASKAYVNRKLKEKKLVN